MVTKVSDSTSYRGRFAPTPSGPLHFGSLVAALGSYLDAKSHHGTWLVRIEDIDPPREQAGAADHILNALGLHGLHWDEPVVFQSHRYDAYHSALRSLSDYIYPCQCNRQRLAELHWRYDGHCLKHPPTEHEQTAIRIQANALPAHQRSDSERFQDLFMGKQHIDLSQQGDFVLLRRDGLFSYQLAVAVDDAMQSISHVIRGADLLETTVRQRYLIRLLNHHSANLPLYGHLPVALDKDGRKLSKQNGAKPLDLSTPQKNLIEALQFLGQNPSTALNDSTSIEDILKWAVSHWNRELTQSIVQTTH